MYCFIVQKFSRRLASSKFAILLALAVEIAFALRFFYLCTVLMLVREPSSNCTASSTRLVNQYSLEAAPQHASSTVRVYTGRYNRAVPCQPSCVYASWASTARHGLGAFTLGFIFELAQTKPSQLGYNRQCKRGISDTTKYNAQWLLTQPVLQITISSTFQMLITLNR